MAKRVWVGQILGTRATSLKASHRDAVLKLFNMFSNFFMTLPPTGGRPKRGPTVILRKKSLK
jgi:hypothetical protein